MRFFILIFSGWITAAYSPYDLHYENAVTAYENKNWEIAIAEFERAIVERDSWIEWRTFCGHDACAKVPEQNHKGNIF